MRPISRHPEKLEGLPQPGDSLDCKYRIEGILGMGGMAVVLAARHVALDERVAIKLLLPQWAEDPALVERFMREGRAATKIRSEHVVRVHDVGRVFGRPYLVMELLEGEDLEDLVARQGPLPIPVAADLLLQAGEAIAEAHASGIVHRDLKPANLFLTTRADGLPCVKVLDFGISKVVDAATTESRSTMPSAVMGSPHYMSPEQMQSAKNVDARTDLWSLGAILHELLAGAPPWQAETVTALCATILRDPPPPLSSRASDAPPALEAVVLRCLEKEKSRRYATIAELARALAAFGLPAAHASAERITRVIEDAGAGRGVPWSVPTEATMRAAIVRPTAAAILAGDTLPRLPRDKSGYAVAALAVLGVLAICGFFIFRHERAMHAAVASANAERLLVPVTTSEAATGPVTTSLTTTTSAAAVTERSVIVPPPVTSAVPASPVRPRPTIAPHPARRRHTSPELPELSAPSASPSASSSGLVVDPQSDPATIPAPAPGPSTLTEPSLTPSGTPAPSSSALPADPSTLFDERK